MKDKIAVDSQTLTYLIQSAEPGYNPLNDSQRNVAKERESIFHIFLRVDIMYVPPTVKKQYMEISKDIEFRNSHKIFNSIHFEDIDGINKTEVEELKNRFLISHKKESDCYAVAEAEIGKMDYFLTFDKDLRNHLINETKLKILFPSDYCKILKDLNIAPRKIPRESNPKSKEAWWKKP